MRALLRITVSLDTPIWKLEAALKCRSYKTERYATPIHMIKLTQQRSRLPPTGHASPRSSASIRERSRSKAFPEVSEP
jgi:hypothetical protein